MRLEYDEVLVRRFVRTGTMFAPKNASDKLAVHRRCATEVPHAWYEVFYFVMIARQDNDSAQRETQEFPNWCCEEVWGRLWCISFVGTWIGESDNVKQFQWLGINCVAAAFARACAICFRQTVGNGLL